MVTPDIVQTVIAAIAKVKEIPAESIAPDHSFEELGMDSLDGLNVVFELESAFGITIPTEDAMGVRSVRDVVESLRPLLSGGTSAPA